jgi:hypothetical protein
MMKDVQGREELARSTPSTADMGLLGRLGRRWDYNILRNDGIVIR